MPSTIVRRALATTGVTMICLAVGAAPAFAAEGTASSKGELLTGNLFGQTIASPVTQTYLPGGTIQQPSLNLAGVVTLDLVGLGVSATGDQAAGQSQAAVNLADAKLTVGVPNVGQIVVTESAVDTVCQATGGDVTGGTTLAGARVQLVGPAGISLLDVNVPVDVGPNTGVALPGGIGEVLINKQVKGTGTVQASGVAVNVLGTGVDLAKVTCGPNIPKPEVPVVSPEIGAAAGGLAVAALAGFGILRHRRKTMAEAG